MSFGPWLRRRCAGMTSLEKDEQPELMALTLHPSKKVCAFKSMTSFGSHYRVDMEEGAMRHVTYDSGVAELKSVVPAQPSTDNAVQVELVRVGVLKNIWVLNYGSLNIVLMVVSWVAKHIDEEPRLRRDLHGFWLANMSARPRDTAAPYLLPALASQVTSACIHVTSPRSAGFGHNQVFIHFPHVVVSVVQVFFVEDKAMPGWYVVLKKEARGRRIHSTEEEHGLGQERASDDIRVFTTVETQGRGHRDDTGGPEVGVQRYNRRRRCREDSL